MEHLRLFLLMTGTVLAGYLCLCLVAPTELQFSWTSPCGSGAWPASNTVELSGWDMERSVDPADSNIMVLRGRWGTHRILADEGVDGQGACMLRLSWESIRWPFLLRGAAAVVDFPLAARQATMDWFPALDREDID